MRSELSIFGSVFITLTSFLTFVNLIFLNWLFNVLTFCQLSVSRFLELLFCVILLLLFFSSALRQILSAIVFALYKFLLINILLIL